MNILKPLYPAGRQYYFNAQTGRYETASDETSKQSGQKEESEYNTFSQNNFSMEHNTSRTISLPEPETRKDALNETPMQRRQREESSRNPHIDASEAIQIAQQHDLVLQDQHERERRAFMENLNRNFSTQPNPEQPILSQELIPAAK